MRALSLDKPSTMGRFLLTSIEDAHKRVDCMPFHEMRLKPLTSVSDVAAPRCAPGFHIIAVTRITLYTPQTVQCAVDDRSRRGVGVGGRGPPRARSRTRGSPPR